MATADFEPGRVRRLGPPGATGHPATIHQPLTGAGMPGSPASGSARCLPAGKGLHAPDERNSTLQAIAARKTLGIGDPRRSFLHSGGLS